MIDARGLNAINVNRVLRQLREDGFVTVKDGRVTFHEHKRLAELAELDESYLDQSGPLLTCRPPSSTFSKS